MKIGEQNIDDFERVGWIDEDVRAAGTGYQFSVILRRHALQDAHGSGADGVGIGELAHVLRVGDGVGDFFL